VSKIGSILHAVGVGLEAASGPVSLVNPAIGAGLHIGGAALGTSTAPHPVTAGSAPDSIHGIAVQAVLDSLPNIVLHQPFKGQLVNRDELFQMREEIETWLTVEASRYTPTSK
jgi:hypothetical protein